MSVIVNNEEVTGHQLGVLRGSMKIALANANQTVPEDLDELDALVQKDLDEKRQKATAIAVAVSGNQVSTSINAGRDLIRSVIAAGMQIEVAETKSKIEEEYLAALEANLDKLQGEAEKMAEHARKSPSKAVLEIRLAGIAAKKQSYKSWFKSMLSFRQEISVETIDAIADTMFDGIVKDVRENFSPTRA